MTKRLILILAIACGTAIVFVYSRSDHPSSVSSLPVTPLTADEAGIIDNGVTLSEYRKDFGFVAHEANSLEYVVKVMNSSNVSVPLEIKKIGCSCTVIKLPNEVQANSSVEMVMKTSIDRREGLFTSAVIVAAGKKNLTFEVKYYAVPPITIDSSTLNLFDQKRNEPIATTVNAFVPLIHQSSSYDYSIVDVKTNPRVKILHYETFTPVNITSLLPRQAHAYHVLISPPQDNDQFEELISDALTIKLVNSKKQEATKIIPIFIRYRKHDIVSALSTVTLSKHNSEKKLRVVMRSYDKRVLSIQEVKSSDPRVCIEFEKEEKSTAAISVKYSSDLQKVTVLSGSEKVTVLVFFRDPQIAPYQLTVLLLD